MALSHPEGIGSDAANISIPLDRKAVIKDTMGVVFLSRLLA